VDSKPERVREDPPDTRKLPRFERGQSVSVTVAYVVDEMGRVIDVRVVETESQQLGSGDVERVQGALLEAIREWEYRPAQLQGQPVKYRVIRKFTYRSG
jgi:TonB family protein